MGRLAVYLVTDPIVWSGGVSEGDQYLLDFTGSDWDALFVDILQCPEPQPYVQGEDLDKYLDRQRKIFCEWLYDYPMLCRIWDLYTDVGYSVDEIVQLRNECRSIHSTTSEPGALQALDKILLACNQALESHCGLFLVSD